MAFRDWLETEAADLLVLPIMGKSYRIPPLGHLDEIRMMEDFDRVRAGDKPLISNEDFVKMALGGALAEMRANFVPEHVIVHAATVAHTDAQMGREAAEQMWEHGPSPEALAAAIRAAASSTTLPSTDAAESSTKPPASTSGTRSARKRTASRSTGKTSSRSRS